MKLTTLIFSGLSRLSRALNRCALNRYSEQLSYQQTGSMVLAKNEGQPKHSETVKLPSSNRPPAFGFLF